MGIEARTQLIPLAELSPGAVGAIRNKVIEQVVAEAARLTNLDKSQMVVRDVRPVLDLGLYSGGTTDATVEDWVYTATSGVSGFTSVSGPNVMADQRFVAIYGVRDLRKGLGVHATATAPTTEVFLGPTVSFIRITVGGSEKTYWDSSVVQAYDEYSVAFSPTAVIIPQNASFNIHYYFTPSTLADAIARLQLIGVTVEPRGKLISP